MRFVRVVAIAVAVAVAVAVCLLLVSIPALLAARGDLQQARTSFRRGGVAVSDGKLQDATSAFENARDAVERATSSLDALPVRLASTIPFVGRNVDVARAVVVGGRSVADAALEVTETLDGFPGDVAGLAPAGGTFQVDRFRVLGEALARARALVARADSALERSPDSLILPTIADARFDAVDEVRSLLGSLAAAEGITGRLPAFLGEDAVRTYLVAAENPAELRGTGGLIGAYALLSFDGGAYELTAFRPIQQLPRPPSVALVAPPAEYDALYGQAREGEGFWLNINMTPDFPTAAAVLEDAFEAAEGIDVAGVIAVDPFALQSIARVGGPIEIEELGEVVPPSKIVDVLSNTAYERITDPAERKAVLGRVAAEVLGELLEGSLGAEAVLALLESASDGHLTLYSDDPAMQDALSSTVVGGAFAGGTGDLLAVIQNNAAQNKVDYFTRRTVSHEVWIRPEGVTESVVTVVLDNGAPSSGEPYIIGRGNGTDAGPGDNVSLVNVYCMRCQLTEAEPTDSLTSAMELGTTFFQRRVVVPSGGSASVRLSWVSHGGWHGSGAGGTYSLRVVGQTMIQSGEVRVEIHLPPGTHATRLSAGMRATGSTVVWEGSPSTSVDLDVAFDAPFPLDVWRHIANVFE